MREGTERITVVLKESEAGATFDTLSRLWEEYPGCEIEIKWE